MRYAKNDRTEYTDSYVHIAEREETLKLINSLLVCPVELLSRYLTDRITPEKLKRLLNMLSAEGKMYIEWKPKDFLNSVVYHPSFRRKNCPSKLWEEQQNVIRASWILTLYTVLEIRDVIRIGYPSQLRFVTMSNKVMDVTVVNPNNIDAIQITAPKFWNEGLLVKTAQEKYKHIALVPDGTNWNGYKAFMARLKKIGFNAYMTLDPDTKAVRIYTFDGINIEDDDDI